MPHNTSGSPSTPIIPPRRPERALAVAALGAVLFGEPFMAIFDGGGGMIGGLPVLFAYIFLAWGLIVLLTALVMETQPEPDADNPHPTPPAAQSSGGEAAAHPPSGAPGSP